MKKTKIIITICIIIILIGSGLFFYTQQDQKQKKDVMNILEFYEPLIGNDTYYEKYKVGTKLWIGGKVTEVKVYKTSYGDLSEIHFDDYNTGLMLWENKTQEYQIGKYYEISTKITEYDFNGHKFVWPDKSFYPKLSLLEYYLFSQGLNEGTWNWFCDITTGDSNSEAIFNLVQLLTSPTANPLDSTSISLRKFTGKFGRFDLNYSLYPEIDHMQSLEDQKSVNNYITFDDRDNNGYFNTNDKITFNIPSTPNENIIETYFLIVGNYRIVIINWYQGLYYQIPPFQYIE